MSARTDVKKRDAYRARVGQFREIDLAPARYLMIDGAGDPNAEAFARAIESLYPLAYALKFLSKLELGRDYVVPPLEGLWWAHDLEAFTRRRDKSRWLWTLMIFVPEWLTSEHVEDAAGRTRDKRAAPRLGPVRLEQLDEGRSVQTLHVGSFDDEGPVRTRLHEQFLPSHGLRPTGKHHEIYLSDFRRLAPDRRRTILRQPVAAVRD